MTTIKISGETTEIILSGAGCTLTWEDGALVIKLREFTPLCDCEYDSGEPQITISEAPDETDM